MLPTKYVKRRELAPWENLSDLRQAVDCIFQDFWKDAPTMAVTWAPAVDVRETDDSYILEADLPGLKREEIELSLENDTITVSGERKHEETKDDGGARRTERYFGRFQRSFRIPGGFDNAKVDAQYTDGVLRVVMPKRQEALRKKIDIQVK